MAATKHAVHQMHCTHIIRSMSTKRSTQLYMMTSHEILSVSDASAMRLRMHTMYKTTHPAPPMQK